MIDVSLGLGVDHAFFCNFLPCPYDGLTPSERVLMAEDTIINEIKAMVKDRPSWVRRKIALPTLVDSKMMSNQCVSHFSQIRFDGDGNVSSCSMMLLDMSGHGRFDDGGVWNNDFFKTMRRKFLAGGKSDLPEPCLVCPDNFGVDPWR